MQASQALPWLKAYLVNAPPAAELARETVSFYSPSTPIVARSGVFVIPYAAASSGGTANIVKTRDVNR